MVLWEITLGTAYFLGLKRTYRLALKIQRRLIKPKHPKLRDFVYRRVRTVFDVALKVHLNIQQRDLEVGRNLGNWILRWLDKMKPSAQIRVADPPAASKTMNMTKQVSTSTGQKLQGSIQKTSERGIDQNSGRHLFTASRNLFSRRFPFMAMTTRPPLSGSNTQYRHYLTAPEMQRPRFGSCGGNGVIRKDIMEWMLRN
uniref:Uncharacterized protein n=1 Tax=Kalanchoe fedtschenkoi TaxID=63787 RepID=A0A7N0UKK5_KALFE